MMDRLFRKPAVMTGVIILILLGGCNFRQSNSDSATSNAEAPEYAVGYRVTYSEGYTVADVIDPWNNGRLLHRYILIPRDKPAPQELPQGSVIRVPIRNAVVYTGVHYTMLEALDAIDVITGVCEPRYINNQGLKVRFAAGLIKDFGEATSPNIEKMLALGIEVIIASPFDHGGYGAVEKTGIPVIECAEYMETEPLGSAEWVKFLGLFTSREAKADSVYNTTKDNYLKIKELTAQIDRRPTMLTGIKYGSAWYVPSGGSFMASIYRDAGADYLFNYLEGRGGSPLSFETVLNKAIHADVWLITYNRETDMTYESLRADYSPYSRFDAFRDRHIWDCNTSYSLYHEEIPLHPDYLLEEIMSILHPQLLPDYKQRYFRKME